MIWFYIFSGIVLFFIAIIFFCIAPGRMSKKAKEMSKVFIGLNCAHRGLHTEDQKVPENSILAFRLARDEGYGIELDVQLTLNEELIVFHDDDLNRMCGVDALVAKKDITELSTLKLFGSDECIPLLKDAIQQIDDTPVIVELKSAGARNNILCQKTYELLSEVGKNWCIESFDPRICAWFRKNAPDILRGQLSTRPSKYNNQSKLNAFLLGNMFTNFLSRPHFMAYSNDKQPLMAKLSRIMTRITAVWTIRPNDNISRYEKKNNIVIFEYYRPKPKYKKN